MEACIPEAVMSTGLSKGSEPLGSAAQNAEGHCGKLGLHH